MKVAVIGVTGMVGSVMLQVLKERKFPITELLPVASEKSVGQVLSYNGKDYTVMSTEEAIRRKPDIALFSAGGTISLEFAPKFAAVGTVVVDNSSAWRMDDTKKLVVPEINAGELTKEDKIIANPNCSTIQMVMVLAPLHLKYKIKRIVISTYQSVSGTGKEAVEQMNKEASGEKTKMVYPYQIYRNAIPHCDVFEEGGYTKEEWKLVNETKKILRDDSINVTATAVRVPVDGGHSEALNIEFVNDFDEQEVRRVLSQTPGIVLQDNLDTNTYPMPLYAHGKDDVFVGRIRRDFSQANTINMWVVADNLRKGAATNTVQIAEYLFENNLIG
jgi:aspartate-semialdehyde dehydrogenase